MNNKNKKEVKTFYGINIISDFDLHTVLGRNVIEVTSAGSLVSRSYDSHGVVSDDYIELSLYNFISSNKKYTLEDAMKEIKKITNADFISYSAVDSINVFFENLDIDTDIELD